MPAAGCGPVWRAVKATITTNTRGRVVRELEEVESEIVLDEARLRALLAEGLDELPVEVERVRAPK